MKSLVTRYLPPRPEDCVRFEVDLERGLVTVEILIRAQGGPGPTVGHGAQLPLKDLPADVADAFVRLKQLAAKKAASDFGYERDTVEINAWVPLSRPS